MTRDTLTNICIRKERLRADAKAAREARDMDKAADAEAELREINLEILRRGKGNA